MTRLYPQSHTIRHVVEIIDTVCVVLSSSIFCFMCRLRSADIVRLAWMVQDTAHTIVASQAQHKYFDTTVGADVMSNLLHGVYRWTMPCPQSQNCEALVSRIAIGYNKCHTDVVFLLWLSFLVMSTNIAYMFTRLCHWQHVTPTTRCLACCKTTRRYVCSLLLVLWFFWATSNGEDWTKSCRRVVPGTSSKLLCVSSFVILFIIFVWSQCLSTCWGSGVDVKVRILESQPRNDKDQHKASKCTMYDCLDPYPSVGSDTVPARLLVIL